MAFLAVGSGVLPWLFLSRPTRLPLLVTLLSLSLFLAHCQEAAGGGTRPGRPPLDEEPRKNPPTTPAPPPLHLRPRVATYGQRTKLEHTRQMGLAVSRGATVTSMGRAMVRYESAPKMTVSTQKSLPR
uniref:Uncharacterized protein n=1 Tax=Triticum urartu TaxID=4572 RepID=A0A8R7PEW8_TRIUA